MASEAGAAPLMGKRDLAKAKELVKESGYNGERIVLLTATDQPIVNAQANVVAAEMREVGLNVDLQAMDWGTLITRRASREPVDKNGWSVFFTWFLGSDMLSPALSLPLRANGEKAWFGWPTDDKLEELRAQWMEAPDLAAQQKIATAAPGRSLRQRAVRADRSIRHPDGLPQEPEGRGDRTGGLPVECGEELALRSRAMKPAAATFPAQLGNQGERRRPEALASRFRGNGNYEFVTSLPNARTA